MVNDYGRAEDIAQDVFMSALRRMRETDRTIAFKPWIYEIAKNACIDQFRRSRRAEEVSYDADEGLGAADYGRLVNTGPTPDVAVDQKMSIDHLRGAFGGLSDTHHQILVMRELEGLSYREIGERLGMSRPSVESTLFRARRRLSEEYEDLTSGERCSRVQAIIASTAEGALGTRDQRKMAKHVAHCQSCRRQARMAGVDVAATARPVRTRIAAFLPLPAFLRRRFSDDDAGLSSSSSAVSHHASSLAQWGAQLSASVDPAIAGWAKAAAAAATIAVAGVGAGAVADDERLDLRSALPSGAVTKALNTERTSVRNAIDAGTSGAAGAADASVTRSGGTSAPAAGGSGHRSSSGNGSSGGSATPAVSQNSSGGSGGAGTPTPPDLGVPGLTPAGDPTGEPTGGGRPDSGANDIPSQVTKVIPQIPPAGTSAPALPGGGGGETGSATDVGGTVDGAAQTVADAITP